MSENINKRTVKAEVLLFSDEAWEQLGGISTLRETIGAVTKFTLFIYFFPEINFAWCVQLHTLFPNDNINTDNSGKLTLDQVSNTWRRNVRPNLLRALLCYRAKD